MNVDLHPEDLLDRLASLTDDEQARLDAHCAACAACAFEIELRSDFGGTQVNAEDEALVDRLIDDVLDDLGPPVTAPRRSLAWLPLAAAAILGVLLLSGGAYAALELGWVASPWEGSGETSEEASLEAESSVVPAAPQPPAPVEERQPATEPTVEAEHTDDEEEPPTRPAPIPSAEEIYTQANAARRSGEHQRALSLYRQLSQAYPGSRQAKVSQVSAGNLALHQMSNPRLALSFFDRYLRSGGSGALALEARVGRALCLGRLGRRAEERRAWQLVVARHPNSVHAERARQRLQQSQ